MCVCVLASVCDQVPITVPAVLVAEIKETNTLAFCHMSTNFLFLVPLHPATYTNTTKRPANKQTGKPRNKEAKGTGSTCLIISHTVG